MTQNKNTPEPAEILLYQTEEGQTRLEVRLQEETVWLTQKRMAELFQKNVRTINEHIQNIFAEGELVPESVIRNFRITADDVKSNDMQHYNLDVIISVGYRVKTPLHIKLDERNHVENPLHSHLNRPDWDIIALMQNLLTGKKCVTPLLTEPHEAGA